MNTDEKRFDQVTKQIIGCAFTVGNTLGHGFLERCYENAMAIELRRAGLLVHQQVPLRVMYDNIVIGECVADLIVENTILVELKAIEQLASIHSAQGINYLPATGLPICLLINFGKRVEVKRLVGPSLSTSSSVSIGGKFSKHSRSLNDRDSDRTQVGFREAQ